MDMKIMTPVRVNINGKFFFTAQTIELTQPKPEGSVLPGEWHGVVINITKKLPLTKKEKEEAEKSAKGMDYDEFFQKMVNAINDPTAHLPIDVTISEGGHYGK
jgi:hypothetical protein